MIHKILNSWRISFFFNLITFIIQQLGLYYILFDYNKLILLLSIFDIYIFIHFCFNYSQSFGAVKGGTCWLLYVYSISIKVIFMYFFAFKDEVVLEDMNKDYYNKSIIFLLLSLSILIYTALSINSYKQLYPNEITISNEKIFHNDLILHVVIDLFDIFELLFTLLKLSYVIKNTNFWIKICGGVLISFSLYLNAYSFPIISIVREKNNKNLDLGDIYFCKKHASVIGIILIDIPFMILRFYFLTFFFSNIHFQPLLIKNICFIPIKCIKIKYCNLIFEKLRKIIDYPNYTYKDKIGKSDEDNYSPYNRKSVNKSNFANIPLIHKKSLLDFNDILNYSFDIKSINSLKNDTVINDTKNITCLNTKHKNHNILEGDYYKKIPSCLNVYFDFIIEDDILNYRKINKNRIKTKLIMKKLMYTNVSNNERFRSYLDDTLKISYLNQLRLMIPYIIYCLGKIAMSIVFYIFYKKVGVNDLKYILVESKKYFKLFEHHNIIFIVSLSIILGNSIISFFSFIFLASLIEVLFLTFFIFVKCFSDFLFLLLLVYNDVFEIFLKNLNQAEKYAPYFFLIFTVIPSFKIIRNIYIFLCSLSGRQFIGYIIRPFNMAKNKSKLPNFLNIKEYNNNISQNSNYLNDEFNLFNKELYSKNGFKGDEKGFISIASLLIYINTKNMHGLCSLSTLLMGNNFIKNLRLNYNLRNNHFLHIIITFFTRFTLLLFLYVHYKSSNVLYDYIKYIYYAIAAIFLLDFLLKCSYMFLSHNLRLCAAYNLELKSIYEDIYHCSKNKKDNYKNDLKDIHKKYQINNFYYYTFPLFSEFI
ncbi:conserved Plasmodium protein, unknown function [Plasmodium gallinaceum]|uniref:TMEM121 domain-containing protein n=1 Tax=Plasmodium gallinaceum TaxID=5849 RepID=A0A1J1GTJ3_PLAGA|nr:conserved Plasmodium protein, unknown function [Plasmodium gallinaceum]CRG94371.1 conserved Plasmodium protein, unknown function [Plasmodium gallinaceum]